MRDLDRRFDFPSKASWLLVSLIAYATCSCGPPMGPPPMSIGVVPLDQPFSPNANVGIQICFRGFVSGVRLALYRSPTDHSNPIYEHVYRPSDIPGHEASWQTGHCETLFLDLAKLDLRAGSYGLEVQPCANESSDSCIGPAPKKRILTVQ